MRTDEIPKFLVSTRYIVVTIASIVLFSAIFLIGYRPFSLSMWFNPNNMVSMLFTLLFYVGAIVILILSRMTMYCIQDRYVITSGQYTWWLVAEAVVITILYTFVTHRYFAVPGHSLMDVGLRALFCIATILAIPNSLISFYASYRSKCEELEAAQYELKRLGEEYNRLVNESEVERRVSERIPKSMQPQSPHMVNFYDNGGTLRLTIDIKALYFLSLRIIISRFTTNTTTRCCPICYDVRLVVLRRALRVVPWFAAIDHILSTRVRYASWVRSIGCTSSHSTMKVSSAYLYPRATTRRYSHRLMP